MPIRIQSRIYTLGSGVQYTGYDLVTSPGQGPGNKGPGSQSGLLPTCRGLMRLLSLTNFASIAVPLERLHSQPLQYWLKENYKTPADLFKGLKPNPEAAQTLLWRCSFKPQPNSVPRPLIETLVTTDASKEGYGAT